MIKIKRAKMTLPTIRHPMFAARKNKREKMEFKNKRVKKKNV
jgi:hypothetical protein